MREENQTMSTSCLAFMAVDVELLARKNIPNNGPNLYRNNLFLFFIIIHHIHGHTFIHSNYIRSL